MLINRTDQIHKESEELKNQSKDIIKKKVFKFK